MSEKTIGIETIPDVKVVKPKPWSEAQKKEQAKRMKQYWKEHPEKKAELAEKIKAGWDDEARQKMATKMTQVLSDPKVKEKMRAGQQAYWRKVKAVLAEAK